MKTLLDLLFGFIFLGIEGEGDGADAGGDGADGGDASDGADAGAGDGSDAGAGADGDDLNLDAGDGSDAGDDADDGGAAAATEAAKALKAAEEKATRLENELAAARRNANGGAPSPTDDQRLQAAEDAQLSDPKTTELERWQINSNRTLRENKRASQHALFQAQNIADKTAFNQLAVTKPAVHKRYADRVETEFVRRMNLGQAIPREQILRDMIGGDALEGKLTPKKVAAKEIDRGKSPGARSDVKGNGKLTGAQAREKRLEGVII